jgi:hypothetical protein
MSLSHVRGSLCHAEYPAVSVGENFSLDTAEHMVLIPICGLLPRPEAANQNRCLPTCLNRQRRAARQLLFVEDNARALAWLATSNLASKNNSSHCLYTIV